jgi:2-amino-4-hydroxy-6-hydroxymethyldihydropteridine diphosphokinase
VTQVCVALGSNLGDRRAHLDAAVRALKPLRVSSYYETPALLAPGDETPQPSYLNAAAVLETSLEPRALLQWLRSIEAAQGRAGVRARWQPRTLDLDLLLYGEQIIDEPGLNVPHPELHKRRFVLEPLAEVVPEARHPMLGKTVRELLAALE